MNYPACEKKDFQTEYFGHKVEDPYRWLTDNHDPEVLAWVKAENACTDEWFEKEKLEAKIQALKKGKRRPLYSAISKWRDGFLAAKREDGYPVVVKLSQDMQAEEIIAERGTLPEYTPYSATACPKEQKYLALYGLKDEAARPSVLIIDCEKREIVETIKGTFNYAWSASDLVLYYSETVSDAKTQESYSRMCAYHADTGVTECVFEDREYSVLGDVHVASDEHTILFEYWSDYSHSRYFSYDEMTKEVRSINGDHAAEMRYIDTKAGEHYFIMKEDAPFGKLIAIAQGKSLQDARVLREEGEEVLDSGFMLDGRVYLMSLKAACARLICLQEEEQAVQEREVKLPEEIGTLTVCGSAGGKKYFQYQSFVMPPALLEFDGKTMKTVLKSSDVSHPDVITEQRYAKSVKDGREIPYFVVRRKDLKPEECKAVWMYAYGGYNFSEVPAYEMPCTGLRVAEWAEDKGIYILASIRGGNEFGSQWHEEGMGLLKKNCYYDMIGIAEQMIEEGWTRKGEVIVTGASNGGLMVSALVTMRPDLFGCVIGSVPHTDMLQFAEDDRGPMYITEYGNPRESEEMFKYLLSYSPYHNVKQIAYPWIYLQTGECDNNVPPYHGKKFAARLQELNQSDAPILLRVLKDGSHDRGAGEVFWRTTAEMQLFADEYIAYRENER